MKSKWLQSSLFLSFTAATLFSGHIGILKARILDRSQTMSVPNPPRPLPDNASPYWASIMVETQNEPAAPVSPLKLEVVTTEEAWIEVETDGQPAYAKLVPAGQTLSFQASESIRLTTGNAKGLDLRFNGEPVTNEGAGRVRTLEFNSAGARLLKSSHVAKS